MTGNPSGTYVQWGPSTYHQTPQGSCEVHHPQWNEGILPADPPCAAEGGPVLPAHMGGTEGVESPGSFSQHSETAPGHGIVTTPGSPRLQAHSLRGTATDSPSGTWRYLMSSMTGRDGWQQLPAGGQYNAQCIGFWRWSLKYEHAVSECNIHSNTSSQNAPATTRGLRTEFSWHPWLVVNRQKTAPRLDRTTQDGHTATTCKLTWEQIDYVVHIQSVQRDALGEDIISRAGGRNDMDCWPHWYCGHRYDSHHAIGNAGNEKNKQSVLTV